MLKYDQDKGGYVVPLDKERLEKAPSYSEQELGADDRRWREPVSSYYNVPPYWM